MNGIPDSEVDPSGPITRTIPACRSMDKASSNATEPPQRFQVSETLKLALVSAEVMNAPALALRPRPKSILISSGGSLIPRSLAMIAEAAGLTLSKASSNFCPASSILHLVHLYEYRSALF